MSYLFSLFKQPDGLYKGVKIAVRNKEDLYYILDELMNRKIHFSCKSIDVNNQKYYVITLTS